MFSMPPCYNRVTGRQMAVSQEENKQMKITPEMGYMLFFFMFFVLVKFRTAVDCINLL